MDHLRGAGFTVHAEDVNAETLSLARARRYGPAPVTFARADAYAPGPGRFDGALAAFWLSHVDLARMDAFLRALHARLEPGAPVMFVSALTGHEITRMLKAARALNKRLDTKIPTAKLNAAIIKFADRTPPHSTFGVRFRIYYATQTGTRPFRIKIFCNQERSLTESYRRYLESCLVKEFDLDGCPIHFDLVGKKKQSVADRLAAKGQRQNLAAAEAGGDIDTSLLED